MSIDYYIVCPEKKIWMPILTMRGSGAWQADWKYMFDFFLACGASDMVIYREQDERLPGEINEEEEKEWVFINSWLDYNEEDIKKLLDGPK